MSDLKCCPFCGGDVSLAVTGKKNFHYFFITRGNGENACECRIFMESKVYEDGNAKDIEDKKNELIKAWNERKPMEKIKEEIMDLYTYYDNDYFTSKGNTLVDRNEVIETVEKGGME